MANTKVEYLQFCTEKISLSKNMAEDEISLNLSQTSFNSLNRYYLFRVVVALPLVQTLKHTLEITLNGIWKRFFSKNSTLVKHQYFYD